MKEITIIFAKIKFLEQSVTIFNNEFLDIIMKSNLITLGKDLNLSFPENVYVKYNIEQVGTSKEIYSIENENIKILNMVTNESKKSTEEFLFRPNESTKFNFPKSVIDAVSLFGMEEIEEKLRLDLNRKNINAICLHGPTGCGKNELFQKVRRSTDFKHFISLGKEMDDVHERLAPIIQKITIYKRNIVLYVRHMENISDITIGSLVKLLKDYQERPDYDIKLVYTCIDMNKVNNEIINLRTKVIPVNMIDRNHKAEYLKYLLQLKNCTVENEKDLEIFAKSLDGFSGHDMKLFIDKVPMIDSKITLQLLNDYKKRKLHVPDVLRNVAQIKSLNWSDIGGYENVKTSMKVYIQEPIMNGGKVAKGVLLHGPPGCSKTMFAQALATECDLNMFVVDAAKINRPYVGESESALRQILNLATISSPSLIFFDEIDKFFSKRGSISDSSVKQSLLSELITFLDGIENKSDKRVIFMAATNKLRNLDEALIRPGRVDLLIEIDIPDQSSRESILRVIFAKEQSRLDIDVMDSIPELAETLAGRSGADIVHACNTARRMAVNGHSDPSIVPMLTKDILLQSFRLPKKDLFKNDLSKMLSSMKL